MKKILIIFSLFLSITSFGQFQKNGTKFNFTGGLAVGNAFFFPTGCGTHPTLTASDSVVNQACLYFDSCAHRGWMYDPSRKSWDSLHLGVSGTGAVDTTDIANFWQKVRSLFSAGYALSYSNGRFSADSAALSLYFLRRKDSLTTTNTLGYVTKKILADSTDAVRSAITNYTFPYSVVAPGNAVQLTNDASSPGNNKFYGTNKSRN
jgi:hypothetical protein